jgi:hypothetical protein
MTPVISQMWRIETVRRFQKINLNPSTFTGEPPHLEAHPPYAVAEYSSNLHFILPYLFIIIFILFLLFSDWFGV